MTDLDDVRMVDGSRVALDLPIKDGHEIRRRTVTLVAAWCAFCRAYVPASTDALVWSEGTGAEIDALGRLSRHLYLAHPDRMTDAK